MKSVLKIYRIFNALSLDVAVGAVVCAAAFSKWFGVHVLPQGFIVLGISVWIIYTMDHLLDVRQLQVEASTFRHRLHQKYFIVLSVVVVVMALLELVLIFFLRKPLFYGGLWLALGVSLYIFINRSLKYLKEVAGALLYSGGVLLPVLTLHENKFSLQDWLLITGFALIALINLILFSWMDYERDMKDGHCSLITLINKRRGAAVIYFLISAFVLLALFTVDTHLWMTITYAFMVLVLFFIFRFSKYFNEADRFRYLGDAIFFLPIILSIR